MAPLWPYAQIQLWDGSVLTLAQDGHHWRFHRWTKRGNAVSFQVSATDRTTVFENPEAAATALAARYLPDPPARLRPKRPQPDYLRPQSDIPPYHDEDDE